MNHVLPLTPFKTVLYNVLLEHGGLPCVLPSTVHLDFGHPPDTITVHLIFLPEQLEGAHKILVSAPVPLKLIWNWV